MDRRSFLKTVSGAAALAAVGAAAGASRAASPWTMSLAAVGDFIPGRRLSQLRDPGFLDVVELLRGVDCAWANCETVIAVPGEVAPAAKGRDPHLLTPPWAADELAWMGVDVVGTANNHTLDWGERGLVSTLHHLDRAGVAHSGAGLDLARASAPGFADTPAGRVGSVNATTTFIDSFPASLAHPYVPGRPGVNPAKIDFSMQVPEELFRALHGFQIPTLEIAGWGRYRDDMIGPEDSLPADSAYFGMEAVVPGERFDVLARMRPTDRERITAAVAAARNNARAVIASLHSHDARGDVILPEPEVAGLARAMIEAGADLFVAAGPHVVRGIEVYQGKPIFHSLGNFVFQNMPAASVPAERYQLRGLPADTLDPTQATLTAFYPRYREFWQSYIPRVTLESAGSAPHEPEVTRVTRIEIHPITLGFGEPLYRRGIPMRARGEEARRILREVAEMSAAYGTEVEIEGDVGKVRL